MQYIGYKIEKGCFVDQYGCLYTDEGVRDLILENQADMTAMAARVALQFNFDRAKVLEFYYREHAEQIINKAKEELGETLCGLSVLDLLADNIPLPIPQLKTLLTVMEAAR